MARITVTPIQLTHLLYLQKAGGKESGPFSATSSRAYGQLDKKGLVRWYFQFGGHHAEITAAGQEVLAAATASRTR